ncbi:MAG: RluA family pseudouridine synthase [Parachlamydiales bacterium]|nr:RluA family pseudouridine synthase [Parachlamydiales bacterium]
MDRPPSFTDEHEFLFVSSEEEGVRIDKLLSSKFPNYSRTYFQHLLDIGCVLLNGEPVKKRIIPEEGDEIEICFQAIPEASLEPEPIPLEILYEDEYILAINKPAGMVVHPAPGHWSGTFVNALLAHCKEIAPGSDPLRPGIVHRLDKDTTGILLAAKTLPAHQKLIELFSTQKIEKLYLAICQGKPTNRIINMPIGRHPVHRKEMTVLPDGREAVTEIQVAACNDRANLVLAKPKTGRTHQIRVHLKHIGCPIIGDPLYGKADLHPRPLLHAYRLSFQHPINGMPMRLIAPIPNDMKEWLQKLCGPSLCMPLNNAL